MDSDVTTRRSTTNTANSMTTITTSTAAPLNQSLITTVTNTQNSMMTTTITATTTTTESTNNKNGTTNHNRSITSTNGLLSKNERRRLKKLKKRLSSVRIEGERSGLLTYEEYEEYQKLLNPNYDCNNDDDNDDNNLNSKKIYGPVINLRKNKEEITKVEGVHHRDLLVWFVQQIQQRKVKKMDDRPEDISRKRRRDDDQDRQSNLNNDNVVSIPHFASIHNPGTIEQVAVLEIHIPNDDDNKDVLDDFRTFLQSSQCNPHNRHCSKVGITTKWFQGHVPTSMSESLFYFTDKDNEKKKKKKKKNVDDLQTPSKQEMITNLEKLILTNEQMIREGFPQRIETTKETNHNISNITPQTKLTSLCDPETIPLEISKEFVNMMGFKVQDQVENDSCHYVMTGANNENGGNSPRVFGVDCEMVMTDIGLELARVTILEFDEFVILPNYATKINVLLDCLVRPENSVLNYLTKHSGITAKLMENVTVQLSQVQYVLAHFLSPNDILVGHSLENDLKAMHIMHPRVVDTSMIFRPSHGRSKFSLRHLSAFILKKKIQLGSHCSEEDAHAALDLAIRKAWLGDELRTPGTNSKKSILQKHCPITQDFSAVFVGPSSWLEANITQHPNGAHALSYDSMADCKQAILSWMKSRRKAQLIWSSVHLEEESTSGQPLLKAFQSFILEILEKLPESCVLMVALQSNIHKAQETLKRRKACQDSRSSVGWSDENEMHWQSLLEASRYGFVQWFGA